MQHTWERRQMHTKFWLKNLKGRDHLENPDIDGKILKWALRRRIGGHGLGSFIRLRIGTGGELL
jgi:hypothetical protein